METYRGEVQLDALGDRSRRAIVAVLSSQGPTAVSKLAEQLPISRPAVSQHLRVLKEAGLVRDTTAGTRRLYALDDTGLDDLRGYFTTFWRRTLDDYAAFAAEHAVESEGAIGSMDTIGPENTAGSVDAIGPGNAAGPGNPAGSVDAAGPGNTAGSVDAAGSRDAAAAEEIEEER
ncbi:ArsR/SmtB family transcription factor [Kribbella sp. NPDC055071]